MDFTLLRLPPGTHSQCFCATLNYRWTASKLNWKLIFFLTPPGLHLSFSLFVVCANAIFHKLARASVCNELNWRRIPDKSVVTIAYIIISSCECYAAHIKCRSHKMEVKIQIINFEASARSYSLILQNSITEHKIEIGTELQQRRTFKIKQCELCYYGLSNKYYISACTHQVTNRCREVYKSSRLIDHHSQQ